MTTATRRRNRLRSAQPATERWKPSPMALVLAGGVLVGALLGLRGRFFDNSASLQQHYLLLVSDLYAQGAPLASVQDRLQRQGYQDPSTTVLAVASQMSTSSDKVQLQEADQLHQFAAALAATTDSAATAAVVAQVATSTPAVISVSPTAVPTSPPVATPAVNVAAAAVPTLSPPPPTATPAAANPPPVAAAPAPVVQAPTPVVSSVKGSHTGIVLTPDRQPAFLRRDPTTKSPPLAIMPYGAQIEIDGLVKGEAVVPPDSWWYKVTYDGHTGYLYGRFVKPGG
jgi:hypothetical protein